MTFSDQVRSAVRNCGLSRYRLSEVTGIDQGVLSRSMNTWDHLGGRRARVGIVSLEMPGYSCFLRLAALASGLTMPQVKKASAPGAEGEHAERLAVAEEELDGLELVLWESDRELTADALMAMAHANTSTSTGFNADLIVVDYLQLLGTAHAAEADHVRVATVARKLKTLAVTTGACVLALAQPSAEGVRAEKGPRMHHLRGSSEVAAAADSVLLVHRDADAQQDGQREVTEVEFLLDKQRNGRIGKATARFRGAHGRFVDAVESAVSEAIRV